MWPIQSAFLRFIACTILFPPWFYVKVLHFTRAVQLIFSILLQHHISKLSKYFWYHTFKKCRCITCVRILILKQLISMFSFRLKSANLWTIRGILVKLWMDRERKCTQKSCKNNPLPCHGGLIGIVTRLGNRRLTKRVSIPDKDKTFFYYPTISDWL